MKDQDLLKPAQKQIVVIGGGIIGISTAYFLAQAGHQVALIEQRRNVAEVSTLGNSGMLATASSTPWAVNGMRRRVFSGLFSQEAPTILNARLSPSLWRWMLRWTSTPELQRYQLHSERMRRLASYSQAILLEMQQYYRLDFEQTTGLLQLFRTQKELAATAPLQALLAERNIAHQLLDGAAAQALEPALHTARSVAGGLYFPELASGNCTLFTKQLKSIAQASGVQFHLDVRVDAIDSHDVRVALKIGADVLHADTVVVAAGTGSAPLLRNIGLNVPLQAVKTYTVTAAIKNHDVAPKFALQDDAYKVTMARLGERIRVAGVAELGARDTEFDDKALRTLLKVTQDWYPDAANYHNAQMWTGNIPMLSDEVPLIGPTRASNVYINVGHGGSGWSMALGAAKIVADQISGKLPEIDIEGLTLARYLR
ncbi:FAD-dependent oxidoreductase [Glaciimonas immobilis]|uniref:D-amino-acid dehydrogenase n=1 Tax=Glaciimonas immobilis TaxID=728004 RepID=A0A840RPN0_9BURK|nr:FAD-dependent oxidoreductase [Glaciimonas immobilis]KAF3999146.1 FAD-dependent oxidoreductase [Glaciimonas immobilis]MBB5198590.1 D-amino-acid dehydrogenase [Glaciimonas immobilis]